MINENRVDELEIVIGQFKLNNDKVTVVEVISQIETFLLDLKIYQDHYRDNMKRQQAKTP